MAAKETMQTISESLSALSAPLVTAHGQLQTAMAEMDAELQAKYDEGRAAGLSEQGVDKIYSQAELDERIAQAVAPLNEQIQSMTQANEEAITTAKAEAIAAFKAELKQKYDEQQVVESTQETGFAALLQ